MCCSALASTPSPIAIRIPRSTSSRSITQPPSSGSANFFLTTRLPVPPRLTYVPVDFERQSLDSQLLSAGFDSTAPAFFAWLGVVPYLTLDAFRATIRFIAERPPTSGIVFDYAQPRSLLPPLEQLAYDSLASRVQLSGEAFQLNFAPSEIATELAAFHTLEDLGAMELNARYFANGSDDLRILGSGGRFVSAWL